MLFHSRKECDSLSDVVPIERPAQLLKVTPVNG